METKIESEMAEGGRQKYKILSRDNHPEEIEELHSQT
ncbi:hypothetical protein LINPERHAP1_LOCUS7913 [Linum perenne]